MFAVIKQGWLTKAPVRPWIGGLGQKARRRWGVLRQTTAATAEFSYYEDETVASIKGTLILTAGSTVSRKTEIMFIVTADKKNKLHATCETPAIAEEWVQNLVTVISGLTERSAVAPPLPAASAPAPAAAPVPVEVVEEEPEPTAGCYLVYSDESGGTLLEHWSEKPVAEALAFFIPGMSVPKYKYRRHGGKQEMLRGIRDGKGIKFFQGICQFFKTAREFKANLTMLSGGPMEFKVFCAITKTNTVGLLRQLEEGQKVDATSVAATGVVAADNMAFDSITKMDVTQFVQHANSVRGAGLFLQNVM